LRIIAKELVEVIKVTSSLGADVRSIQRVVSELEAAGNLELAIEIPSAVGQRQEVAVRRRNRSDNQVIDSVPLLVSDPNQQPLRYLPVKFDIPGPASGVSDSSTDDVGIRNRRKESYCRIESQKRAIRKLRKGPGV